MRERRGRGDDRRADPTPGTAGAARSAAGSPPRRSRTWLAPSGAWVRAFDCRFRRERLTSAGTAPPGAVGPAMTPCRHRRGGGCRGASVRWADT
jgi:hypothetical protein